MAIAFAQCCTPLVPSLQAKDGRVVYSKYVALVLEPRFCTGFLGGKQYTFVSLYMLYVYVDSKGHLYLIFRLFLPLSSAQHEYRR